MDVTLTLTLMVVGSMAYDAEAMELRVQLAITAINRSFTSLQTITNEEGEPVAIMVQRACAMWYGNDDITVVCKHDVCADVLATLAHAPLAAMVELLPTASTTAEPELDSPASKRSKSEPSPLNVDHEMARDATATLLGMGLCLQFGWYPVQVRHANLRDTIVSTILHACATRDADNDPPMHRETSPTHAPPAGQASASCGC
jgi:hypothetical protein